MRNLIAGAALVLAACAPAPVAPPLRCPALTAWSAAEQDQLRREYDALAPDARMRAAFRDYVAMRDAARVCIGRATGSPP